MDVRIRPIRASELPAVDRLLGAVFTEHAAEVGSMVREFAYCYPRANLRFGLGAFVSGRLVAHAVARLGTLIVPGGRVGWASYGNVATLAAFRGQGIAGRLGTAMFRKLRAAGVDVVYISGTRSLYLRAGAAVCGAYRTFTVKAGALSRAGRGLAVRPAGPGAVGTVARMLAVDPVRFADGPAEVRVVLRTGRVQCRVARTWIVTHAGRPVAFAVTGGRDWGSTGSVVLHGGLRLPLAAALPAIVRRSGWRTLPLAVPAWDHELTGLLMAVHGAGVPTPVAGPGSLRILDPRRLGRRVGIATSSSLAPRALARLAVRLFGTPDRPGPVPLPLIGLRYM